MENPLEPWSLPRQPTARRYPPTVAATAADRCAFTGIREAFMALGECFVDASHLIKEVELIGAHTEASKIPLHVCVCVCARSPTRGSRWRLSRRLRPKPPQRERDEKSTSDEENGFFSFRKDGWPAATNHVI